MLGQRHRRWPNIKQAMGSHFPQPPPSHKLMSANDNMADEIFTKTSDFCDGFLNAPRLGYCKGSVFPHKQHDNT